MIYQAKHLFLGKDLHLTLNWVKETEPQSRDNSMFNQICQDSVKLLLRYQEAYIFNQEQLSVIETMCNKKRIEFEARIFDGYIMLLRK